MKIDNIGEKSQYDEVELTKYYIYRRFFIMERADVSTGKILAEGKTKRIFETNTPNLVIIESKDDLTAGDGAKHDVVIGKAKLATQTTCNVFKLLQKCGIPLAFINQIDDTRFWAEGCDMIPYEVVVRREAHGSYLKRRPDLKKGHIFPRLIVEFFLKTSDKKWGKIEIPKDDPLAVFDFNGTLALYLPDQPLWTQSPFLVLRDHQLCNTRYLIGPNKDEGVISQYPLCSDRNLIGQMSDIATKVFLILEKAWQLENKRLVDFKIEFGINSRGELKLADVIDNDSWRVLDDGRYIDKQVYRDGGNLDEVTEKYKLVANLTGNFHIPEQRIIFWRASETDDLSKFEETFTSMEAEEYCETQHATCSLHKEPIRAYNTVIEMIQKVPDTVIIVLCGRSNGAGPTLSAQVSVPVITVPANLKDFPEDVWSSLRAPGQTPVMTVLDPGNAVIAALQILSVRNPKIYSELRFRQEKRLKNITEL